MYSNWQHFGLTVERERCGPGSLDVGSSGHWIWAVVIGCEPGSLVRYRIRLLQIKYWIQILTSGKSDTP